MNCCRRENNFPPLCRLSLLNKHDLILNQVLIMATDILNSLQKWSDTNHEVLKISKDNNSLESILQRNINIHHQLKLSENMNEFFNEVCSNMNNLLTVPFNDFVSFRCGK